MPRVCLFLLDTVDKRARLGRVRFSVVVTRDHPRELIRASQPTNHRAGTEESFSFSPCLSPCMICGVAPHVKRRPIIVRCPPCGTVTYTIDLSRHFSITTTFVGHQLKQCQKLFPDDPSLFRINIVCTCPSWGVA